MQDRVQPAAPVLVRGVVTCLRKRSRRPKKRRTSGPPRGARKPRPSRARAPRMTSSASSWRITASAATRRMAARGHLAVRCAQPGSGPSLQAARLPGPALACGVESRACADCISVNRMPITPGPLRYLASHPGAQSPSRWLRIRRRAHTLGGRLRMRRHHDQERGCRQDHEGDAELGSHHHGEGRDTARSQGHIGRLMLLPKRRTDRVLATLVAHQQHQAEDRDLDQQNQPVARTSQLDTPHRRLPERARSRSPRGSPRSVVPPVRTAG